MKEILDSDHVKEEIKPKFNTWVFLLYLTLNILAIIFIKMHWFGAGLMLLVSTSSMFVYPLANLVVFGFNHIPNNIVLFFSGVWYFFNLLGIMNWRYMRLDATVDVEPLWVLSYLVITALFFIPHVIHRAIQRKKMRNQ